MPLKLQFDANQLYQIDAINSVVDLFDGRPRLDTQYLLSEGGEIVPNLPEFDDLNPNWLLGQLGRIQQRNGVEPDRVQFDLWQDNGSLLLGTDSHQYPHFTLEMETGTGKTYVYLRTIYELRRRYGFGKFVIVVPSVAIYEGVVKSVQITRDHFRALYDNETVNLTEYDGEQLSRLRGFASSTFCEVLVMTLDSFNKTTNVLYRPSEKLPGARLPHEYIQATRPILILDEPQNMESDIARRALRTLRPLFALRYSATHKSSPNLVYRLSPVDAYQRGLVKKIEVAGVAERENVNRPLLLLKAIKAGRGASSFSATVRTLVTKKGVTSEADISLKQNDELSAKTKRAEHAGYGVSEINLAEQRLHFANGEVLRLNEDAGQARISVFRTQIEETIRTHLKTQAELREKGIKVLSLFFIDRVANYTAPDGLIRQLFDELFEKLKHESRHFSQLSAEQVRTANFAKKKIKAKDNAADGEEAIDTASSNADERKAEKAAFSLIMRDKERLLSFDEPTCFIFAHSALREGWDNPNVFQICTLRQSGSEMERRQTLGRGLRLCVDQHGERIHDEDINVLTVVANESYQDYAQNLQHEYAESGDAAPPLPTESRRNEAKRNEIIFDSDEFERFWQRISKPLHYVLRVETPALIDACIERLNAPSLEFPRTVIDITKGRINPANGSVRVDKIEGQRAQLTFQLFDQYGRKITLSQEFREGEDLTTLRPSDPYLRRLANFRLVRERGITRVQFATDKYVLEEGETKDFGNIAVRNLSERSVSVPEEKYPVFNLIDRAAKELGMTKPTINAVYKGLREERKRLIFENPEGFASVFIAQLRNGLADHVTERLSFVAVGGVSYTDKDELFPATRRYPQREVLEAGQHGLYDKMQKDSDQEQRFVERLRGDDRVEFYFKFPAGFKIDLPRIIGDYNPDWGIARLDRDQAPIIHKVRETKGTVNLAQLRFPHEVRKIKCAHKYFAALGVDYREVTGDTAEWWKAGDEVGWQLGLRE